MRTPIRNIGSLIVVAGLVGLPVFIGCSDDDTNNASYDAGVQCPGAFGLANGATCSAAGLTCDYLVACGAFDQQARCACGDDLKFACTTTKGTTIEVGSQPPCEPLPPASATCSQFTSVQEIEAQPCTVSGEQCFFAGVTCDGRDLNDVCMCSPTATPGSLAFKCEVAGCNGEGGTPPIVDAGKDSDTPDGS